MHSKLKLKRVESKSEQTSSRVKINVYSSAHCSLEKCSNSSFLRSHSSSMELKKKQQQVRNEGISESKLPRTCTMYLQCHDIYVFTDWKEKLISHHERNRISNVFYAYRKVFWRNHHHCRVVSSHQEFFFWLRIWILDWNLPTPSVNWNVCKVTAKQEMSDENTEKREKKIQFETCLD